MTSTPSIAYPGSAATEADLLALAQAYRTSALCLLERPGDVLPRAPATLCAIHAIELYLSAFLLHHGSSTAEIRGYCHDLAERGALALARGLTLRRRTAEHLVKMTRDREYLVSRYGAEDLSTLSPPDQLLTTLNEVASQVIRAVDPTAEPVPLARRPPRWPLAIGADWVMNGN